MEQRTVERFRKRAILMHWLFALSFIVMLITGSLMFFDLTNMGGGIQIRAIHRITAVILVLGTVSYILFDTKAAVSFAKESFRWDRDARLWLRKSLSYYFTGKGQMPPQGYINGDQKLWQLLVTVTGVLFILTGILLWFFKLKIPLAAYQGVLLTHGVSFLVILLMFPVHFYLTTLHRGFEESLSSMVDGKVSESYAQEHYSKWFKEKTGKQ